MLCLPETCVVFCIRPVRFVYKGMMKGNFEKPQKFDEFIKLSTKSCMSRTMNDLKESFTFMKAIATRTTTLKMMILQYVMRYIQVITSTTCTYMYIIGNYRYRLVSKILCCQDLGLIFSRKDRTLCQ